MWPPLCLTTSCKRTLAFVTTFRHKSSESLQRRPEKARKCSAAQGPHSEVVPCAFWRLVSKSCDECKGSFARGCEAKRWSHWTCYSLGTIFQPMRINSVPEVKWFCNNKNVLRAQSMVWHFVRHSVFAEGIATTPTAHHATQQHRQFNKSSWKFRLTPWFCQQSTLWSSTSASTHAQLWLTTWLFFYFIFYVTVLKGPGCWQCGHYARSGPFYEAGLLQLHMRSW